MEVNLNKENFKQEVLESDKTVLVDFWATWCGPCQMIAPVVEDIAKQATFLLKSNSSIYIVHRPDRLADIIEALRKYKLEPKNIRLIYPKINKEPNLVSVAKYEQWMDGTVIKIGANNTVSEFIEKKNFCCALCASFCVSAVRNIICG